MIYINKKTDTAEYEVSLRTRFMLLVHTLIDTASMSPVAVQDFIDNLKLDFRLNLTYESNNHTEAASEGVYQDVYIFQSADTSESLEYTLLTLEEGYKNIFEDEDMLISVLTLPSGQYRYELYCGGDIIGDGKVVITSEEDDVKLTGPSINPLSSLSI